MKSRVVQLKVTTQSILRQRRKAEESDCIGYLMRCAAKSLIRALHVRLAEQGVPYGHWAFLRILWERDGVTQRELSIEAGVKEATTFSALKTMEQLGYIKRRQMNGNRKNVQIYLTARGRGLKAKLMPLAFDVNHVALRGARPTDMDATRAVLRIIIENLAVDEISASLPPHPARRHKRGNGISLGA